MQLKNNKKELKLCDCELGYNRMYDCVRRAVINFYCTHYAEKLGYSPDTFEYVMLFVKKSYKAFYNELENAQKGNL